MTLDLVTCLAEPGHHASLDTNLDSWLLLAIFMGILNFAHWGWAKQRAWEPADLALILTRLLAAM